MLGFLEGYVIYNLFFDKQVFFRNYRMQLLIIKYYFVLIDTFVTLCYLNNLQLFNSSLQLYGYFFTFFTQ